MLSPFPWIDFPEPRCPQFPVSVSAPPSHDAGPSRLPRGRTLHILSSFNADQNRQFGFPEQSNFSEVTKAHVTRTPVCPSSIVMIYLLVIGTPERFHRGKQIGMYLGMIPSEDSSAGKQRLGHISKQGNSLLRYLLSEAAQAAARFNPHWKRDTCIWQCVVTRALPRWRWGDV
jgi:hypothetical protein